MALPKTPPGPAAIVTMSPPKDEAGVSSDTDVIGAVESSAVAAVFSETDDGSQVGVRRGRRGRKSRGQGKGRDNRRHQVRCSKRHRPVELEVATTTLAGRAAAVGMVETFHYLLRLDSSVLDRGRDTRQLTISAQAAHEDESKRSAKSFKSPSNSHARITWSHSENRSNPAVTISQRVHKLRKSDIRKPFCWSKTRRLESAIAAFADRVSVPVRDGLICRLWPRDAFELRTAIRY